MKLEQLVYLVRLKCNIIDIHYLKKAVSKAGQSLESSNWIETAKIISQAYWPHTYFKYCSENYQTISLMSWHGTFGTERQNNMAHINSTPAAQHHKQI